MDERFNNITFHSCSFDNWIVVTYIAIHNDLRCTVIKVEEARSDIDVALIKRYDVLVSMLDFCDKYVGHEKESMLKAIHIRTGMTSNERIEAINITEEINQFINSVVENKTELMESDNFKQFQAAIMDVEEHLQAARRLYNGNVSRLNQKIVSFPGSIVAKRLNITRNEFLY